jgi:two-component system chemotaxis sensor kinase CheA
LRGCVLPLISFSEIFHLSKASEQPKYLFAVVIKSGKQQVGLLVDALLGEEEVVVKPLGSFVGDIPGISSATILGNGQVALIIDVFHLFKLIGM